MHLIEASKTLVDMHGTGLSHLMVSGPGVGKTTVIRDTAAALAKAVGGVFWDTRDPMPELLAGQRLFIFHLRIAATYDSPDVRGFMVPSKEPDGSLVSSFTWPDIFPKRMALKNAIGVMVCIDEFGQASHETQKPLANVLLEQSIGDFNIYNYVPADCKVSIVAATNRTNDRSGVMRELAFVTNRVGFLNIDFNLAALLNWMNANQYHPAGCAFIEKNPGVICETVPDAPGPFCTPRSLCNGLLALQTCSSNGKLEITPSATERFAGWVGPGAAAQAMAFLKHQDQLPEQEDIERNPKTAKFPTGPDSQFITSIYVARWLAEVVNDPKKGDEKAKAYLTYISRMPRDLQVAAIKSAAAANSQVVNTAAFGVWGSDKANNELLVASFM